MILSPLIEENSPFDYIPDDVLTVILSLLDLSKLCRCSEVSKRFLRVGNKILEEIWFRCKKNYGKVTYNKLNIAFF